MKSGPGCRKQRGAALLVLLTIMVLGAATLLVTQLNHFSGFWVRDRHSMQALAQAKAALIGWAVSHPLQPGLLPFPDRNGDGDYDGNSDCPATVDLSTLTGRLPGLGYPAPCVNPQGGLGVNPLDGSGEPLWYSVSSNLVYDGGYPVINSDLRDEPDNWITVIDGSGNLLSDRVAAVIIAPGGVLGGQSRGGGAPAVDNYLDSATVGGTTYSNSDLDLNFIAAQPSGSFNDRLIYITIDELLDQVERVVARRIDQLVRPCLTAYAAASGGKYPWAAQLDGSAPPDYTGDFGSNLGRLPETLNIDVSPGSPDGAMQASWNCHTVLPYWSSWRELVFYEVAADYQPGSTATCGSACLTLDGVGGKPFVIMLAGGALAGPGQQRSDNMQKGDIANYLEADNADGDLVFENGTASSTFNDQAFSP
ncbi:MAG TPA: hypothetical protein ENI99_03940 [Sedimenticola sp.]|nr:hypothetical protein [Sedimenticola sp.]